MYVIAFEIFWPSNVAKKTKKIQFRKLNNAEKAYDDWGY